MQAGDQPPIYLSYPHQPSMYIGWNTANQSSDNVLTAPLAWAINHGRQQPLHRTISTSHVHYCQKLASPICLSYSSVLDSHPKCQFQQLLSTSHLLPQVIQNFITLIMSFFPIILCCDVLCLTNQLLNRNHQSLINAIRANSSSD